MEQLDARSDIESEHIRLAAVLAAVPKLFDVGGSQMILTSRPGWRGAGWQRKVDAGCLSRPGHDSRACSRAARPQSERWLGQTEERRLRSVVALFARRNRSQSVKTLQRRNEGHVYFVSRKESKCHYRRASIFCVNAVRTHHPYGERSSEDGGLKRHFKNTGCRKS